MLETYKYQDKQTSFNKGSSAINNLVDNIGEIASSAIRSKRASIKSNEISVLEKTIDMKDKESVKIDAFMRVFGADTAMYNYRKTSGLSQFSVFDDMQSRVTYALKDFIQGAKNVDIDVARSLMFLDSALSYPTIAGFPLRLAVNGTATIALSLESQMDLPSIFKDPQRAEIKLKLSPLSVTELSAAMTVDIGVANAGVKMVATIHSSFATHFSARMLGVGSVDIKLDLPKSKITLVDIKSELLFVEQNMHRKLEIADQDT